MGLLRGTMLGSCEIIGDLGAGGMGEVYRGRDTKLGREVAVKALPDAFAHDSERLARFEREAKMLAALNHPNIAVIFELKEIAGSTYLILELVEGMTLAERIAHRAMPANEALEIAGQIAEALEAAHEKGIIHRDLKPANVKVTPGGRVKVLDFGLAKVSEAGSDAQNSSDSPTLSAMHTTHGLILGTAAYMSPEQARGKSVDKRADVWSFGCILYEMLTGRQTFPDGETPSDTLAGVLAREPDWQALPENTTPRIRTLLERCLTKDAQHRLRDMGDIRIEIEDARKDPPAVRAIEAPQGITRSRRAAGFRIAAVAILLLVAVGLGIFILTKPEPELLRLQFEVSPPQGATFTSSVTLPRAASSPWATLSPDGRKLAFISVSDLKQLIWIRPLDTSTAQPLQGTDGAVAIFWSADSQYIGFFSEGKVKKVPAVGGAPEVLCDSSGTTAMMGAWSEKDVILFSGTGPLRQVSASGGQSTSVTELDPSRKETTHGFPAFLPDGRHFLYLSSGDKTVFIGELGSKDRRMLPGIASQAAYSPSGHVIFLRDGTLMAQSFDPTRLDLAGDAFPIAGQINYNPTNSAGAFSVSSAGGLVYRAGSTSGAQFVQLAWVDRTGRQLMAFGPKAEYGSPELSPDGRYVAFTRGIPLNVWWYDIQKGLTNRLTNHSTTDTFPAWSPDSRTIAFVSLHDKSQNIGTLSLGVIGEEKSLVTLDTALSRLDWSRDNQYIAYVSEYDIWAKPLGSGDKKSLRITNTPRSRENYPRISPDGHWIAYTSDDSGSIEVYIQSFPQGDVRVPVSSGGGVAPRWSRNGEELYYATASLMAVKIKTVPMLEVGIPTPLFPLPGNQNVFDVDKDGRFLMISSPAEQVQTPVTVVLNWAAGLKK